MLSDKFGGKFDHKELINNQELMFFAFDKKILQFFQDEMSINILIDNFKFSNIVHEKVVLDFYYYNCCMKFMPFGKFFIVMPFENYAI